MSYDIGPRIGIEGEAEYRKSIRNLNAGLKAMVSEMAAVTSAYDKNDQSVEKLGKQNDVFKRQAEAQRQKLSELTAMLEKSRDKYGENDEKTQKWQRAVNDATAQLNNLERELTDNNRALDEAKSANVDFARAQQQAEEAAEKLKEQQEQLAAQVGDTSSKLQKSSEAMGAVNKAATVAAAAIAALGAASAKVGMDFEAGMSEVQAISRASSEEMTALTDKAKVMGAQTKFSASESADAFKFMAQAGWDAQAMLDGIGGVMDLAAASGEDLALTSSIVTDTLTAFGMAASDAGHFADVLAMAANASNTGVAEMGYTFKYVAPVAGALGYSIEDVSVAIGLMANSGIKAETAGTALRATLTNLAKPSDTVLMYMERLGVSLTDAQGNVLPFNKLMDKMRKSFSKLTDAQKAEYAAGLAGKEAMSGLLAIVNASDDDYKSLTKSINNANGAAKEAADIMQDNLKGSVEQLGGALETAGLTAYEKFEKPLRSAVDKAADAVGDFAADLASGALDNKLKIVGSTAAAAGTAIVAMNAALAVKDIANFANAARIGGEALERYTAATKAGAAAQGALNLVQSLSPMGVLAIAVGAAATGLLIYRSATHEATTAGEVFDENLKDLNARLDEQTEARETLEKQRSESLGQVNAEITAVQNYVAELKGYLEEDGKVREGYEARAGYLAEQINTLIPGAVKANNTERDSYYEINDAIDQQIIAKKKAMVLEAMQDEYMNALKNRAGAETKLTEAQIAQGTAQEQLNALISKQNELWNAQKALSESTNPDAFITLSDGMAVSLSTVGSALDSVSAQQDIWKTKLDEANASVSQAQTDVDALQNVINTVTTVSAANEMSVLDSAISGLSDTVIKSNGDNQQAINENIAHLQTTYDKMVATAAESWGQMSEDQKTAMLSRLSDLKNSLDAQVAEAINGGANIAVGVGDGFRSGANKYPQELQKMINDSEAKLQAAGVKTIGSGQNFGKGFDQGMVETINDILKTVDSMGSQSVNQLNTSLDEHSPSRKTRTSGRYFSQGLALGIEDGESGVIRSAIRVAQAAVRASKKELGIHSPSRVMRDTVGLMIGLGVSEGIEKSFPAVEKTARRLGDVITGELDSLNADLAKMQETERQKQADKELADYKKSIQKKYDELGKAEKKDKQKILDEIAEMQASWNEKQVTAESKAAQDALKAKISALQDYQKEYQSAIDEIQRSQDSMSEKLKSYGDLFKTVQTDTGSYLELGDLQTDIDQITAYGDALDKLKERGVSDSLMEEITSMNVDDALGYMDMLLDMTDTDYAKYIAKWNEKQQLAADTAKKFYQGEFDSLQSEFVDKIPDELSGIKDDMKELGSLSAQGVASGFKSQKQYIIDTFKSTLESALSAARASMDIHSPSRRMAKMLGAPMAQGVGVGFVDQMRTVAKQINDSIPVPTVNSAVAGFERVGESVVNGVAAAMQGGGYTSSQPIVVQLVMDSKVMGETLIDPVKQALRRRGDTF